MSTHPLKRVLPLQPGESDPNKIQKSLLSSVDASVHDHSRGTIIIASGNNNSFHHGPTLTQNTFNNSDYDTLIQHLTRSHNAEYDMRVASAARGPCTPDTRIAVLQEMLDWCNSDTAMLYWLSGMAGTGKTTIAYTVCQKLVQSKQLGASFFCSRSLPDCRDVKLIIPTIAFQLARRFGPFSEALASALRSDEYVLKRDLGVQLRQLIIDPWAANKEKLPLHMTVVLEALDECDDGHSEFLQVIVDHVTTLPFKVMMTSRPEPAVRDTMIREAQASGTLSTFILHEVESDLVREDIEKYLTSQLSPRVEPNDIRFLTDLAGTLFIFAATLVRFLTAKKVNITTRIEYLRTSLPPDTKLKMLSLLDELYKGVLGAAFHGDLMEVEVRHMRETLFTVIYTREPLTRKAIASLWSLREEEVEERLDPLRSVIYVPDEDERPITVFHASFLDFIEDPARSKQFCCHRQRCNLELLQQCLILLKHELHQNVCEVEGQPPNYTIHRDIIHQRISLGLQYAVVYWPEHWMLCHYSERQAVSSLIYDFLTTSVLYWFECLSLIDRLFVSIESLELLIDTLNENSDLVNLMRDQLQCIQYFYDDVEFSAMVIYCAALTWTPSQPALQKYYTREHIPRVLCGLQKIWTPRLGQEIHSHTDTVKSIAVSRDGRSIVSGSRDNTLRIWNVRSRVEEHILNGHTCSVNAVAISRDGSCAISGSSDGTIRFWNIATQKAVLTIKTSSAVYAVTVSFNNKWLASGHFDRIIRIWDMADGRLIYSLQGHTDFVRSISLIPNGTWLVSGSYDKTARLWNTTTWQVGPILHGHTDWVLSVACSSNNDKIVTGSCDNTARLWDVSGRELHVLRGHSGHVSCVAFMSGGKQLVTGSNDKTLRVWDTLSGNMIHAFTGLAYGVESIAVFPDRLRTASSSGSTISIWSLIARDTISGEENSGDASVPNVKAESMVFLANGQRVLLLPSLRILDTVTLKVKTAMSALGSHFHHGAWSASGSRVAALSQSRPRGRIWAVQVWELTGDVVAKCFNFPANKHFTSISFSHDERRLVSAYSDTVGVWDIMTRGQINVLIHPGQVYRAVFSHDDTRIVSITEFGLHVWDIQSGEPLYQLDIGYSSAMFSPDDQHIIASDDDTISIYNAQTFQLEHIHKGYKHWAMMNDGSSYSLSDDGWICYSPCFNDQPRPLLWVPSQYRPTSGDHFRVDGPLFTSTATGVQVCLPRTDGLVTLVIPRDT